MWTRKVCPALLFLGALILFGCTLAPTVTFVDSGELIVTARNLGVAHPPGFPLYLLLAHLATWLPLGNIAQRVHFASALFAAIAVALVYLVTVETILTWKHSTKSQKAGKNRSREKHNLPSERPACIAGIVSGSLAAFSRTLWSYATVAEVYTLNAMLILLVFLFVLRWRNHSQNSQSKNNRLLYLAALIFGLALGVHHVTVALTLPAVLWLVFEAKGIRFFKSRQMLAAFLACLIGCAIYIYLPIAASRAPVLNWGNPDSLSRIWAHISGRQYLNYFSLSSDQIQRQIASFTNVLFREFGWPWIPAALLLAAIGLFTLWRRDRRLLIFLILVAGFNLLFSIGYEISEDKDAYSLPIFLALALAAGFGAYAIQTVLKARRSAIAEIILLLVPVLAFASNIRLNNRRSFRVAEDYISNIFSAISPHGMLLTADWQVASPLLYFQEIDQQRPDVVCIDVMLLRRSWYLGYLEAKYPALMHAARESVQSFLEDLLRWEKDPDAFKKDPQLTARIDEEYCSMVSKLAEKHLAAGPVYSTIDVVLNSGGENQTLSKALLDKFQIVPQGLVFQLFPDRGFHPVLLPRLNLRGLTHRPTVVDQDPVVRQKVIPVYALMLVNCGRGLSSQGDAQRAAEAFGLASDIDSSLLAERHLLNHGN